MCGHPTNELPPICVAIPLMTSLLCDTLDDMQNLMQLNFISIFALCRAALPFLRATQGNIINMSSLVGAFGQSKAT